MTENYLEPVHRPKAVRRFSLLHWIAFAVGTFGIIVPLNALIEYNIGHPGEAVTRDLTRPFELPVVFFAFMWLVNWILLTRLALPKARFLAIATLVGATLYVLYLMLYVFNVHGAVRLAILIEMIALTFLFQDETKQWWSARSEGREVY